MNTNLIKFYQKLYWVNLATDNDSSRYALGGIAMQRSSNFIIGTDGRRLHYAKLDAFEMDLMHQISDNHDIKDQQAVICFPKMKKPTRNTPPITDKIIAGVLTHVIDGRFPNVSDVVNMKNPIRVGFIPNIKAKYFADALMDVFKSDDTGFSYTLYQNDEQSENTQLIICRSDDLNAMIMPLINEAKNPFVRID